MGVVVFLYLSYDYLSFCSESCFGSEYAPKPNFLNGPALLSWDHNISIHRLIISVDEISLGFF